MKLPSKIYAEVVTFVAGSLEAVGLPGYPKVFDRWNKRDEVLTKLGSTLFHKQKCEDTKSLTLHKKVYMFLKMRERNMVRLYR